MMQNYLTTLAGVADTLRCRRPLQSENYRPVMPHHALYSVVVAARDKNASIKDS